MIKYFTVACLLILVSCNQQKKQQTDIIAPEKMKLVFWDYLRANEYAFEILKKDKSLNDTLVNIQLQNLIFNHYKISRTTFYRSYSYYTKNSNLLVPILDSMIAKHENTRVEFDPASFLKDGEKF
jgi:hypothetical protein